MANSCHRSNRSDWDVRIVFRKPRCHDSVVDGEFVFQFIMIATDERSTIPSGKSDGRLAPIEFVRKKMAHLLKKNHKKLRYAPQTNILEGRTNISECVFEEQYRTPTYMQCHAPKRRFWKSERTFGTMWETTFARITYAGLGNDLTMRLAYSAVCYLR